MKKYFEKINFNIVAVLIMTACLIVAGFTVFQRTEIENNYDSVEISIDYKEMEKFAVATDEDLEYWLKEFNAMGAKSTAIEEETINTLIDGGADLTKIFLDELIKLPNWEETVPSDLVADIQNDKISEYDGIVKISDYEVYEFIIEGLELRYPDEFYEIYSGKDDYLVLFGTSEDAYYSDNIITYDWEGKGVYTTKEMLDLKQYNVGIGFSEEKIEIAKEAGFDIILRAINYEKYPEKLVDAYINEYEKHDLIPRLYLTLGKDVVGYEDNLDDADDSAELDELEEVFKEHGIYPILIESENQRENIDQNGIFDLAESLDNRVVRGFSLWDWVRERYAYYGYEGAEEIENSIYRAVTERNVRYVYFKPFFEDDNKYLTDIEEYEETFINLENRLADHGLELDLAEPIESFQVGNLRLAIICLGIAFASVFLFNNVFGLYNKYGAILYVLAFGALLAPYVSRSLTEILFSLLAAIAFSGIAILYLMTATKKIRENSNGEKLHAILLKSTVVLVITSIISIIGGVFVVAVLNSTAYMVELEIFRGVKASQMLPFVVFAFIFVFKFWEDGVRLDRLNNEGVKKSFSPIVKILNANIKIYYVILLAIAGIIAYIYIARTGHETSVEPFALEIVMRNFLENVLKARPRSKEFLIAFPAIFCAVYSAYKKIPYLTETFLLLGVIATSSIINTFCHLRTTFVLSLERTLISMIFGIIVGVVAVLILNGLYRAYFKIKERLN